RPLPPIIANGELFPRDYGAEGAMLDRINLISFFPRYGIGSSEDQLEDGVLAVTSMYYLNQDVDFSDPMQREIFLGWLIVFGTGMEAQYVHADSVHLPYEVFKAGSILDADIIFNP